MADGVYTVKVNGKPVTFEWHRFFGPSVLKKNGDLRSRQPGMRSPFWPVFDRWFKRNRKRLGR